MNLRTRLHGTSSLYTIQLTNGWRIEDYIHRSDMMDRYGYDTSLWPS